MACLLMAIVLALALAAFVGHAISFWFFTEDDGDIIARDAQQLGEPGSVSAR